MRKIDFLVIPLILFLSLAALAIDSYQPSGLTPEGPSRQGSLVLALGSFEGGSPGEALVWLLGPGGIQEIPLAGSNVCHKALSADLDQGAGPELYAATGQNASVLSLTMPGGEQESRVVWSPGCSRVRDLEAGDVDGDGSQELVAATHGPGKVAVIRQIQGKWETEELVSLEGAYVHEVELYDADGDGAQEIFSTPSEPNQEKGLSQPGRILMHRWNGSGFTMEELASFSNTHAKEICIGDPDNDGLPELAAALQGTANRSEPDHEGLVELEIEEPARIMLWDLGGTADQGVTIAELPDIGARALAIGDADNDGLSELVVGADTAGLYLLSHVEGSWEIEAIDPSFRGVIRDVLIADHDGDGLNEVLASSDSLGLVRACSLEEGSWACRDLVETSGSWVWGMHWGDAL